MIVSKLYQLVRTLKRTLRAQRMAQVAGAEPAPGLGFLWGGGFTVITATLRVIWLGLGLKKHLQGRPGDTQGCHNGRRGVPPKKKKNQVSCRLHSQIVE